MTLPVASCQLPVARPYRTKGDILPKGSYSAVPSALMADASIPPLAKLVFAALVDHLRGRSTSVRPSAGRLAAMVAACERSVRRSLDALAAGGWIEIETRPGRPALYRFPKRNGAENDPGQNVQPSNNPGQNVRRCGGGENNPGQNVRRSNRRESTKPRTKCPDPPDKMSDEALVVNTNDITPPYPPGKPGGTGGGAVGGLDGGGKDNGKKGQQPTADNQRPKTNGDGKGNGKGKGTKRRRLSAADKAALESAVGRIGEAYRTAIGADMPHSWRTKIGGEFRSGDRSALGEIDSEVLSAVAAMCAARGQIFCLANVVAAIHAAKRSAAAAARRGRLADERKRRDKSAAAEAAARRAAADELTASRLAAFRDMPAGVRDHWIAEALGRPGPPITRPDLLEKIAAVMHAEAQERKEA